MPANSVFSGPMTSVFNALSFDGEPFICQRNEEDKKAYGFVIWNFYGWFSNDILAVKGLMAHELEGGEAVGVAN